MTANADMGRVMRIDAFKAECRCGWWDRMVSSRENADKMLAAHLREKHGPSGTECGKDVGRRPEWMSRDQYDPCRCLLAFGHEGDHACVHSDLSPNGSSGAS